MFQNLFNAFVRKKLRVIRVFQLIWAGIIVSFIFAASSINSPDTNSYLYWYDVALLLAKTALIFL